jgi:cytochrome c556
MKNVSFVVVMLALTGVMSAPSGNGQERKEIKKRNDATQEMSRLMKRKLENSQKVLEGLALNNFDKIGKHADELISLSKQAEWKVLKTPEYELFSNEFRRSAAELVKNAKGKNLDGVTLAYVDLTFTCVRCHKYVREARRVQIGLANRPVVVSSGK